MENERPFTTQCSLFAFISLVLYLTPLFTGQALMQIP